MKIETAIEILEFLLFQGFGPTQDDTKDAIKLGIEALKLVKLNRELWGDLEALELPGETRD